MKMIWYGTASTVMHSGRVRIVFDPAAKNLSADQRDLSESKGGL